MTRKFSFCKTFEVCNFVCCSWIQELKKSFLSPLKEYFCLTNSVRKSLFKQVSVQQRVCIQFKCLSYIFRILCLLFKNLKIEVGQLLLEVTQLRENYIHTRAAKKCISFGARGKETNYVHFTNIEHLSFHQPFQVCKNNKNSLK